MTQTLADGLLEELKRNRELLMLYKQIGPNGAFGAAMIEADIQRAEKAMVEQDIVAMLQAYEKLKESE